MLMAFYIVMCLDGCGVVKGYKTLYLAANEELYLEFLFQQGHTYVQLSQKDSF